MKKPPFFSWRTASRPRLATVAVLATFVWFGCTDDAGELPTAPEVELQRVVAPTPQDLGPAIAAAKRHTDRLMRIEGVVGTAVGLDDASEPAVKVYTVQPGVRGIPNRLDDVPVNVLVTGMFVARSDPTTRERPAPVGYSVGHPDITAGTLGARVTDGSNVYILSNNHVIAASNEASIGDPTLQPGAFDGGSEPDDVIGTLHDFEEILFDGSDNAMDAAVTIVDAGDVSGSTPDDAGYGSPGTTVTEADLGMAVQKYGRTTGHTHGAVEEINVTVSVCYQTRGPFRCARAATFVDQISITPGDFSGGGDSGSLIVTDGSGNNPVGLLFAGSTTRTIANPIGPVLDRFGVSIDPTVPDGNGNGEPGDPVGPTADFTHDCTDLSCTFDASSSTPGDADIASYDWEFGDGNTDSGEVVSHTYASGDSYTVTLTVTDGDGLADTAAEEVTVSEAAEPGDFTLTATGYKVRGLHKADLEWSGAESADVDIFRDGSLVATLANDGFFTDDIDNRGSGSYSYQVCEAGSSTCSNEATVTF